MSGMSVAIATLVGCRFILDPILDRLWIRFLQVPRRGMEALRHPLCVAVNVISIKSRIGCRFCFPSGSS